MFFGYVQFFPRAPDSLLTRFPQFVARVLSFIAFFDVVKDFHISKSHNFFLKICCQCETSADIKKLWKWLKWYFAALRFRWLFVAHEIFEVKFKTAGATCVTIGVIKQANQTISENYLWRLNQEREPVTFKKLSKTPKDDYFLTHRKEVLYKSQHQLTLITTKNTSKKLTSLEHKI